MSAEHKQSKFQTETVLVLQGGGSLGAYECGVYNTLYRHGIQFNIIAGSSIGGINASIITSAQNAVINASDAQINKKTRTKLRELEPEYHELAQERGAVIKETIRIGRVEKLHYLLKDTDFSPYRIKKLIREREEDAERVLANMANVT